MKEHIKVIDKMIEQMDMDVVDGVRILPTLLVAKEAFERMIADRPTEKGGEG